MSELGDKVANKLVEPRSHGGGSGSNSDLYILEVRTVLDESIRLSNFYSITRKWSRFPLENGREGDLIVSPNVAVPYRFPSLHWIEAHEKLLEFDQAYAIAVWLLTYFDVLWLGEQMRRVGPIEVRMVKVKLEYRLSVTELGIGPIIDVREVRRAMKDKFEERAKEVEPGRGVS